MTKFRLHRKIWLAAPVVAATAAFGLIAPAQAQASHPSQVAGTPATSTQPLQKLFGHPPADGKRWLVTDPVAYSQALKSKQWMYTPSGLSYTGCVYHVPDHGTVRNGVIIAPNGARQQVKPCQYPTLTYPGASKTGAVARGASEPSATASTAVPCDVTFLAPWWADSCSSTSNWVTYMIQEQAVPSNPARDGALIFLWGGLADSGNDTVLQDVLTWGANSRVGVTNPNIWYVTPWYVWSHNNAQMFGNSIHVGVSDTIVQSLTAGNCSGGGACAWGLSAVDENNGLSAGLNITSDVAFTEILGSVMEVPAANGCVETPSNGQAAFRDLEVQGHTGTITPNFGISYPDRQCSIALTQSSTGGTITWKP